MNQITQARPFETVRINGEQCQVVEPGVRFSLVKTVTGPEAGKTERIENKRLAKIMNTYVPA